MSACLHALQPNNNVRMTPIVFYIFSLVVCLFVCRLTNRTEPSILYNRKTKKKDKILIHIDNKQRTHSNNRDQATELKDTRRESETMIQNYNGDKN